MSKEILALVSGALLVAAAHLLLEDPGREGAHAPLSPVLGDGPETPQHRNPTRGHVA